MLFRLPPDRLESSTTDRAILEGRLTAVESRIRELQKKLPSLVGDQRHESEIELRDLLRTRRELEDKLRAPTPLSAEQQEWATNAAARRQAIIDAQVREDAQLIGAFVAKCESEGDFYTARLYRAELLLSRERAERLFPK